MIIPAILPKSYADLDEKINLIYNVVPWVQIDICDGGFVPSLSWPKVEDFGEFDALVNEDAGLPHWEDLDYEIHIMARTPQDEVADWVRAGATRVLVHMEAGSDQIEDIISEWGHTVEIGISMNTETPVETILPFLAKVNTFQLMGISKVGFQGQKFEDGVLTKIKSLRALASKHIIAVDGGVNLANARKIIDAGADRLVVGSAIWETDMPGETIKKFEQIIK